MPWRHLKKWSDPHLKQVQVHKRVNLLERISFEYQILRQFSHSGPLRQCMLEFCSPSPQRLLPSWFMVAGRGVGVADCCLTWRQVLVLSTWCRFLGMWKVKVMEPHELLAKFPKILGPSQQNLLQCHSSCLVSLRGQYIKVWEQQWVKLKEQWRSQ